MPKAIVIGASSGIGHALCKILSQNGYELGLVARRQNLLFNLQKELPNFSIVKQADVTKTASAIQSINELITEMGDIDLFIVNSGVVFKHEKFSWNTEETTIDVNVMGFAAMAFLAMNYFSQRGKGHLVGISSITACFKGRSWESRLQCFKSICI